MRLRSLLLLATLVSTPLAAETQRHLVVGLDATPASRLRLERALDAVARREVRALRNVGALALDLTPAEAAVLRRSRDVAAVEPVVSRHALGSPESFRIDVSRYSRQVMPWGVPALRVPEIWPVTRGENINVAVLDTGIDAEHPDLAHAYQGGHNTITKGQPPIDDHTHGTHVAGTIAAADNAYGIVGVAPAVRLWGVKVLGRDGSGTTESVIAGIDWVVGASQTLGGRWVINLSLGSSERSAAEALAVRRALDAGIVVVAAAGNDGIPRLSYPAAHPGVIAVGAVTDTSVRASFSSYGPQMSVMAPGVRIPSTVIDGVVRVAQLDVPGGNHEGWAVRGSPMGTFQGELVDCGLGFPEHIPPSVRGQIAFIQRGEITFREKARNAKEAGAVAVVIWNNVVQEPGSSPPLWVLDINGETDPDWLQYKFPLTIGVTREVGESLKNNPVAAEVSNRFERYGSLSGTSMAAPHIAGVAALLLALDPTLTPERVKDILERTARDIHDPGWDRESAWGVVDALAAARVVAPASFPWTPRRRAIH